MRQTGEFREYLIVFTSKARLNWFYRLFTRHGMRHCEIYTAIGDASMSVCQTIENVEFTFYKENINEVIKKLTEQNAIILYLPTFKKPRKLRLGILIPSCVGNCMMVSGVSFNRISVHGYYRDLIKYGATRIS